MSTQSAKYGTLHFSDKVGERCHAYDVTIPVAHYVGDYIRISYEGKKGFVGETVCSHWTWTPTVYTTKTEEPK